MKLSGESDFLQPLVDFLTSLETEDYFNRLFSYTAVASRIVRLYNDALSELQQLKLVTTDVSVVPASLVINVAFQQRLTDAFANGKAYICGLSEANYDAKYAKTVDELKTYGTERWESILYLLALPSGNDNAKISSACRQVLQSAGFIQETGDNTKEGYKFLLTESRLQVWSYLCSCLNYYRTSQTERIDFIEALAFLFQLSFTDMTQCYSSEGLSLGLQDFLQHLREVGLIFQAKRKSMRFYTTHLATRLFASMDDADSASKSIVGSGRESGCLIIESNFRIYTYSNSPLQLAILSTFVDMKYRLPNFVSGVVTRKSVRRAIKSGITPDQIVKYLRSNSHADMKTSHNISAASPAAVIPPNVTDQINLWSQESDRFQMESSVLYSQFESETDFIGVRNFAQETGVLLWQKEAGRVLVVESNSHDSVRRFYKQLKSNR